jgi:hypothetical protein
VLSGCSLAPGSTKLVLKFNASLLRGEKVRFKGYNKTNRASATQVAVGSPFPRAEAEANTHRGAKVMDYPKPWQNVEIELDASSRHIVVDLGSINTTHPDFAAAGLDAGRGWTAAELAGLVTGVRYARWAVVGHPLCCGDVDFGTTPCPPNSCPLSSSASDLPAMPFEAELLPTGKCRCLAPQVCDE